MGKVFIRTWSTIGSMCMVSVKVPKEVLDTLIEIRDSNEVNMMNHKAVIDKLIEMGKRDAAKWVIENKVDYIQGVMWNFAFEEE